ncbi:hypothetical protein PVAG01_10656 [Phlyctema vagabunda]|uniref:Uncharacterized protein n=1 Tax=Phlyctema vagabunda TaxID=108571 RepID=A0ABR4P2W3_9HELO
MIILIHEKGSFSIFFPAHRLKVVVTDSCHPILRACSLTPLG